MAATLLERVWTWLHATFPERQLYLRSDGRVQFFTLSPTLQATCAGLVLIFLGWVAFASVNVIFKDRIIAAKDHRYEQMQSTYENRLADLQVSYDEINGALVSAEDTFRTTADQLETKQRTVTKLLDRKIAVDHALASLHPGKPGQDGSGEAAAPATATAPNNAGASDSVGSDGSSLNALPLPPPPQPRTAKPTKASMLDGLFEGWAHAVSTTVSEVFPHHAQPAPHMAAKLPAFRVLAAQTERLKRLSGEETALLIEADRQLTGSIAKVDKVLRAVGILPADMEARAESGGVGGPFVPLSSVRIEGIADPAFTEAFVTASAHVKELDALFAAFTHVPLTTPVHGAMYEQTSDFGPRIDPFTHRVSFHPGLDYAGPWGSLIFCTAPGTVVWAGMRGGYGNMVEIDHGFGIHTRYGHMSAILVHVGDHVKKGTPVGKLGSTGRSTGPHVHYEVWLGDVVRDPSRFIEAGRHVLE